MIDVIFPKKPISGFLQWTQS